MGGNNIPWHLHSHDATLLWCYVIDGLGWGVEGNNVPWHLHSRDVLRHGVLGSTSHVNLCMGWYVTGDVQCSWLPWCRKKGDQAMRCSLWLTSQLEQRSICVFFPHIIYIYIHIFIYLSLYYHRYISTIHEEKLATLCPFSISSIFWWPSANIAEGLLARVYDLTDRFWLPRCILFFGGGVGLVSLFLRLKHDLFKASVCSLFWHFIWQHFIWFIWSKPHWYVHVWSFLTELCRESLPNSCVPGWYYSEYSSYLAFKSLYFMFE